MKREPKSIDWTDRDALRKWFAGLAAAIEDEIAVTDDMVRPLRQRTLGPAEARRLQRDAAGAIRALLDSGERGLVHGSRAKQKPNGSAS